MADSADSTRTAPTNHFLWLGPVIAVAGLLSYFLFFAQWPMFRDTAWLNLLIVVVGIAVAAIGMSRAMSSGGWRAIAGVGSALVAVAAGAALVFYVFILSNQLPSAEGVTAEGEAIPSVALASYDGDSIDVAVAAEDLTILVFYRGFW